MTLNLARLNLSRTRLPGLFAGGSLALWGLWLLSPFELFSAFGGVYSLMARVAPEWVWGAAFVAAGLTLFVGELRQNRLMVGLGAIGVLTGRIFVGSLTAIYTHGNAPGVPDQYLWALMALVCVMGAFRREP